MQEPVRQLVPPPVGHGVRNHTAIVRRGRAIAALLQSRTVAQAAAQADIGTRTLE
jgi:hypothetical protein